jgi:hypothetical protein
MDLKQIRYNMEEIIEEAQTILQHLRRGSAFTEQAYYASMQHLIHHVNTAWNARDISLDDAETASPAQRLDWARYPEDIRLV